jgi:hypothetical protein
MSAAAPLKPQQACVAVSGPIGAFACFGECVALLLQVQPSSELLLLLLPSTLPSNTGLSLLLVQAVVSPPLLLLMSPHMSHEVGVKLEKSLSRHSHPTASFATTSPRLAGSGDITPHAKLPPCGSLPPTMHSAPLTKPAPFGCTREPPLLLLLLLHESGCMCIARAFL